MKNLNIIKPDSINQAFEIAKSSEASQYLAGGQTLIPTLKFELNDSDNFIDLSNMKELNGVCEDSNNGVVIGAMTSHANVAASSIVLDKIPSLADLASNIGDRMVRNMGTIGGSLANNDPSADYPASILAPIQVQKRNKKEAEEYGMYLLCQMGIESHAKKYPGQLSGGEQQRVAIARSLALKPELLLFDEPTSALDPERINEVLDAMRRLADQGMTMIVVTHEIKFAKEVSDQVLFIDSGKILEISPPEVFFSNASHERSRKFLNQIN